MNTRFAQGACVLLILGYIVAANLIISAHGVSATPYVAAGFGLVFVLRDHLNDLWRRHGSLRMAALIGVGALVAYFASKETTVAPPEVVTEIAKWSAIAYAASEAIDWLVYVIGLRLGWPWLARSNVSNVFGGFADSLIFISGAFGFSFAAIFAQWTAKVFGGVIVSVALWLTGRKA